MKIFKKILTSIFSLGLILPVLQVFPTSEVLALEEARLNELKHSLFSLRKEDRDISDMLKFSLHIYETVNEEQSEMQNLEIGGTLGENQKIIKEATKIGLYALYLIFTKYVTGKYVDSIDGKFSEQPQEVKSKVETIIAPHLYSTLAEPPVQKSRIDFRDFFFGNYLYESNLEIEGTKISDIWKKYIALKSTECIRAEMFAEFLGLKGTLSGERL